MISVNLKVVQLVPIVMSFVCSAALGQESSANGDETANSTNETPGTGTNGTTSTATDPTEPAPTQTMLGCSTDMECKGDRICVDRQCVSPQQSTAPPPLAVSPPATQPPQATENTSTSAQPPTQASQPEQPSKPTYSEALYTKRKRLGLGLFVPGVIITVLGGLTHLANALVVNDCNEPMGPEEFISTEDKDKCIRATRALFISGFIGYGVGLSLATPGLAILIHNKRRYKRAKLALVPRFAMNSMSLSLEGRW